GNRNTGNCNTGYWNTGTNNAGNWNAGNRNTGFFCENTPKPLFFDVTTDLSWEEARGLVPYIEIPVACKWVYENDMTQEEKTEHPSHKTTGGYLRSQPINLNEAFLIAWAGLDKREKMRWLNLPNFDAKKFNKITGVELSEIIELQESK
ncbi:MAG: hypothetical protein JKX85_04665, partial [Phycisphaeraceae bacterium]|nr:hypothetical protein [Phycisphaeraceae bacterium]